MAASIGPYGAFLADGSEYRGDYGISSDELRNFHAERLDVICQMQPDLLACETIPSAQEAEVLRDLLSESSETMAWVSFSCADGERICDGTPIQECAALFENCPQVFAIGLNCTAPKYVRSLIEKIRIAAQANALSSIQIRDRFTIRMGEYGRGRRVQQILANRPKVGSMQAQLLSADAAKRVQSTFARFGKRLTLLKTAECLRQ